MQTINVKNTLLSNAQYHIERERSKIKALKVFNKDINALAKALTKTLQAADAAAGVTEGNASEVSMWCYYYDIDKTLDVTLSGRITGLDSLKDERLANVLDALESKLGIEFCKSQDEAWRTDPSREFSIEPLTIVKPDTINTGYTTETPFRLTMTIKISASARSDSPTCRKVQTGVKMEETPVYEIQCE